MLITHVHGWISDNVVRQRFKQINAFEALIHESGTAILKFFLHISKEEQKERLGWASQRKSDRDAVLLFFL